MFTDSTCPDSTCKYRNRLGYCTVTVCVAASKLVAIREKTKTPTIDSAPIKGISQWLAAYAAPPLYASDHVAALKNKVSIKTETERAEAWEYHWQHLIDCGLLQEDEHADE